jgi:hypothetical protein
LRSSTRSPAIRVDPSRSESIRVDPSRSESIRVDPSRSVSPYPSPGRRSLSVRARGGRRGREVEDAGGEGVAGRAVAGAAGRVEGAEGGVEGRRPHPEQYLPPPPPPPPPDSLPVYPEADSRLVQGIRRVPSDTALRCASVYGTACSPPDSLPDSLSAAKLTRDAASSSCMTLPRQAAVPGGRCGGVTVLTRRHRLDPKGPH